MKFSPDSNSLRRNGADGEATAVSAAIPGASTSHAPIAGAFAHSAEANTPNLAAGYSQTRAYLLCLAAGAGTRLGAEVPKAFLEVQGRTLVEHALQRALAEPRIVQAVLVAPPEWVPAAERIAAEDERIIVVSGGQERADSVAAGLAVLPGDSAANLPQNEIGDIGFAGDEPVVLVHDAARALAPTWLFSRVLDAVLAGAAGAIPGVEVTDTIKVLAADGTVDSTPMRSSLRAVQTPQGFPLALLRQAHAAARARTLGGSGTGTFGATITDDSLLVEALGQKVQVVPGTEKALKVTYQQDLRQVQAWLAETDDDGKV